MFWPYVENQLGMKREDVQHLDKADPKAILRWVFDSVTGTKGRRRRGGDSDPNITPFRKLPPK